MTSRDQPLAKHIFLEFGEYQHFLELKKRNEELVKKNRELENEIKMLKTDGRGLQSILEKEAREKINPPLVGQAESITLPPGSYANTSKAEKKWYFLGKPQDHASK